MLKTICNCIRTCDNLFALNMLINQCCVVCIIFKTVAIKEIKFYEDFTPSILKYSMPLICKIVIELLYKILLFSTGIFNMIKHSYLRVFIAILNFPDEYKCKLMATISYPSLNTLYSNLRRVSLILQLCNAHNSPKIHSSPGLKCSVQKRVG